MNFNPNAIAFWGFSALVGYLIAESVRGALIGLAIGLGVSLSFLLWRAVRNPEN